MPLDIGSRLGHYDVTALIGEGGMGQVYRARDTKLDRDVALKVECNRIWAVVRSGATWLFGILTMSLLAAAPTSAQVRAGNLQDQAVQWLQLRRPRKLVVVS